MNIGCIKTRYPKGSRIRLICMEDPFAPVDAGTKGTVRLVDDMGTIHVDWDNGRRLGVIPGIDSFEVIAKGDE